MATGTTSFNDREYLFRLQTLIIDGGTDVLRNIFDQRVQLQNMPLNVFLANEKKLINRLRAQKTITTTQYHKLYPPGGQLPNSSDFDITLIICLLRNLPSLGLNPNYSWNVPPQPADTSVEADLCRLKGFRNEIAHISSTTGFQQTAFQNKWSEIEQVLLRLNQAVIYPIRNLTQAIGSYKNSSLDPVAEKRIQADIEQWREMEKGLEKEMQLIKHDVSELKESVLEVKTDIQEVIKGTKDIALIEGGIGEVKENVGEMKLDVKNVKGGIAEVNVDIGKVKEDVQKIANATDNINTVTAYIEKVKESVEEVKLDITNFKKTNKGVKEDTEEVKKDVKEVMGDIIALKGNIGEVKQNVEAVMDHVEKVAEYVKKVELQKKKKDTNEANPLKELEDDLISFYRDQHSKITLSPLVEEDTPLLEFYVMPDIKSVEIKRARGGGTEEKTLVSPFRNVFYKGDTLYRKIYLTADAGLGKTALSKRLALTWSYAKKPLEDEKRYFLKEEIEAMNEFCFVFLLLLRDSSSQCDIDAMIMEQIVSRLGHNYTLEYLKDIQCKETCLIILDGLDEWTHPSNSCMLNERNIPHRKARDSAILTTTRPWKLSVSGLKPSDMDQRLEISGLNQKSASTLKSSVISHLSGEKDKNKLRNDIAEFSTAVKEKQISDLEAIPLLLMYLIFLWYYVKKLGNSQCELYYNVNN